MRYEREIFLATVILCALSAVLYLNLYHLPLQLDLLQSELKQQQAAKQTVDILNFKNRHGDLNEVMLELDEQRTDLERALPPQLYQGEFIGYLQSTAQANQIRLTALTPDAAELDEALPIIRLPLRVRLECTYFGLLDFLKALEESERLINIEKFTARSSGDGEQLMCELKIVLFSTAEEGDDNAEVVDGGRIARTSIDGDS